jgi:predicted DNA-binding transcriptional regulator AlpA
MNGDKNGDASDQRLMEASKAKAPTVELALLRRVESLPPGLPRLLLWKRDLCVMLGVSERTLSRMLSTGELPPATRRLRGRPVWLAKAIDEWAEKEKPRVERNIS